MIKGPRSDNSDKARLKLVPSARENSLKIENLLVPSLDTILPNKRITNALTRLRRCAGWSAPLLSAIAKTGFFASMPIHRNAICGHVSLNLSNRCKKSVKMFKIRQSLAFYLFFLISFNKFNNTRIQNVLV